MQDWQLELSTVWDVLGPFPISAREQHFLSPSFPIDLSSYQYHPGSTWPSSLADGGQVSWKSVNSTADGRILVSHPDIRWESLRSTEGWAALQHHNVLRTTLKITPPTAPKQSLAPWLVCSLKKVSFFTLIRETSHSPTPEWHPGNIYSLPNAPRQLLELPELSFTEPTIYHIYVSGDYEIRLFGDPTVYGRQHPILDIDVEFSLAPRQNTVALFPTLHVVCDFVQGWAFGSVVGIGIQSLNGEWKVLSVTSTPESTSAVSICAIYFLQIPTCSHVPQFSLTLLDKSFLVSSQTRIVPILLNQRAAFEKEELSMMVTVMNTKDSSQIVLMPTLSIRHWNSWEDVAEFKAIRATYLLAGTPTMYLAIPPLFHTTPQPPIIALHGAGVEISQSFWPASLLRQPHSWIVCPSGRTSWGLDWHGPSTNDAWGSLAALTSTLSMNDLWSQWKINESSRVVVIGHSNGGQGTWYMAARHPDRVLAAVPAAAYIKSQQYVPLSMSRGSHFIDPSHAGILFASLAPDDNDLFMSNLVDTQIMAIHGGADENVPTWHSRELVGLVKSWNPNANVTLVEEVGQPHWYPNVLSSDHVQAFISSVLNLDDTTVRESSECFTLTVLNPDESGSLHGFSIREVNLPGRLARLSISRNDDIWAVKTRNVHTFSVKTLSFIDSITVDGLMVTIPDRSSNSTGGEVWIRLVEGSWKVSNLVFFRPPANRPIGSISRILSSSSPIQLIMPSADPHALSIARRLAHVLLLYFQIDTVITPDFEALQKTDADYYGDDIIIIGSSNAFGSRLLSSRPGLVKISPHNFTVGYRAFTYPSQGIIFNHPHPSNSNRMVIFMCANDIDGLERLSRLLLPIRTGVPLPEFLITSKEADTTGIGGLSGGGFWDRTWGWSEEMAWLN
ncbi:hypothetical protein BU17DRAFT_55579 [Hysterangium stoloniferum]|nr:hypothetical protein BU17DRAFT_55579 [Hysterangium stoloniferum]